MNHPLELSPPKTHHEDLKSSEFTFSSFTFQFYSISIRFVGDFTLLLCLQFRLILRLDCIPQRKFNKT